ncbi:TPA: histone acetyltransferase [Streptococcus suis]|nr:histone acetyltransferase [Streptococcus suis]
MKVAEEDKGFVAPNARSLAVAWLYRENGSGKELDKF